MYKVFVHYRAGEPRLLEIARDLRDPLEFLRFLRDKFDGCRFEIAADGRLCREARDLGADIEIEVQNDYD